MFLLKYKMVEIFKLWLVVMTDKFNKFKFINSNKWYIAKLSKKYNDPSGIIFFKLNNELGLLNLYYNGWVTRHCLLNGFIYVFSWEEHWLKDYMRLRQFSKLYYFFSIPYDVHLLFEFCDKINRIWKLRLHRFLGIVRWEAC